MYLQFCTCIYTEKSVLPNALVRCHEYFCQPRKYLCTKTRASAYSYTVLFPSRHSITLLECPVDWQPRFPKALFSSTNSSSRTAAWLKCVPSFPFPFPFPLSACPAIVLCAAIIYTSTCEFIHAANYEKRRRKRVVRQFKSAFDMQK